MTPIENLKAYGLGIVNKRIERLLSRKFVLFPWLRVALLIRKIKKLETLS